MNEAPALVTANVGIAMGTVGTDTAIETADVALVRDDLAVVPKVIRMGRRTLSMIRLIPRGGSEILIPVFKNGSA